MHIYGQEIWHDEALIIGTEESLIAMRDAIDEAIKKGRGETTTCASDFEGYRTIVVKTEEKDIKGEYWQSLDLPYSSEDFKNENPLQKDDIIDYDIVKEEQIKEHLKQKEEWKKQSDEMVEKIMKSIKNKKAE